MPPRHKHGAKPLYPASSFALELDHGQGSSSVGLISSVEGGGIRTEILDSRMGNRHGLWRQLSIPKYEDIKFQVGMSMSKVFYEWIERFFTGNTERMNGAIVSGNVPRYEVMARRRIEELLISEVSIPKADGSDHKSQVHMTVGIVAERIRFESPSGGERIQGNISKDQKLWLPCNFDLTLDQFGTACKRVSKIDPFTIKQQILEHRWGRQRDAVRVPGQIEFPNISIYLPEVDAQPFMTHFTKHVIQGEPQADTRCSGHLEYWDSKSNPLCRITLAGVDVASVTPERSDVKSKDVKLVKVDLSVESMKFQWLGGGSGSPPGTSVRV